MPLPSPLPCSARLLRPWALLLVLAGCGGEAGPEPAGDVVQFSLQAFAAPDVAYRPWVRWWWPGADVEEAELRREVRALAAAGFGGAEVQAFDAGLDPTAPEAALARRRAVGTPAYLAHVRAALDEAASAGLSLDLTLGSGWPTGGPHVLVDDSLQTLAWAEARVEGPASVTLQLGAPAKPPWYVISEAVASLGEPLTRFLPEHAVLEAVIAAPVTGGLRLDDPLELTDQLTLDPARLLVLTDRVGADGVLRWDAPEGVWQVVAFHRLPDGQPIQLHAWPGEAFVTDHLDAARVEASLEALVGEAIGLLSHAGAGFSGLFVDSFELKDERLTADDFLAEFEARRGYDPVPWLPAVVLPGADNNVFDGAGLATSAPFRLGPADARVQHDWALTVSDLFVERFGQTAAAWAEARGLRLRMQAYGLNVQPLRAAGTAHVPETEQLFAGGSELALKLASSAAHLHDRPFASAETLVWAGYDHSLTPTRLKAAVDKLVAAGVAHIVFHGFPYRVDEGFGEPGWHPFSSPFVGVQTAGSNLGEGSPWWSDLPQLNRYISRLQLAMQTGQPRAQVLVYYPWLGFPASFSALSEHVETLFNGRLDALDDLEVNNALLDLVRVLLGSEEPDARAGWLLQIWPTLEALHAGGYAWDWVDDERLLAGEGADGGGVRIGGQRWDAVLLHRVEALPAEVAEKLAQLGSGGLPVAIVGDAPATQPGFFEREAGDGRVAAAMAGLGAQSSTHQQAGASGLAEALGALGVAPALTMEPEQPAVRHVHRRLGPARSLSFLWNRGRANVSAVLRLPGGCEGPVWLDPWTGQVASAVAAGEGGVQLELAGLASTLLLCGQALEPTPALAQPAPPANGALLTDWSVRVVADDVADGEVTLDLDGLADWRTLEPLRLSAGPGVYTTTIALPAGPIVDHVWLDLGRVEGVCEVELNGTPVARLLVPPFVVDLNDAAQVGPNTLTVKVWPPVLNRYVGKALAGDPLYAHLEGRADRLAPAGLLGPVTLVLAERANPAGE